MNLKKKVCILALPLFLASCGMNEKPDAVLMKNQQEIIGVFSNLSSDMAKGEKSGNAKIDLLSKGGDINMNLSYKLQLDNANKKNAGNIAGDVKFASGTGSKSINFDLDLVNTEKKIFVKLNKINDFDPTGLIPMDSNMIKGLISSISNKWFFIENQSNNNFDLNKYNEIINIIKKYQLFKLVKQNENKDFYDYDVKIDSDNYIKMISDLYKFTEKKDITKDMTDTIKKDIESANVNGNLKIDPSHKEYFVFTSNNSGAILKIENSKKVFSLNVTEGKDNEFLLSFDKNGSTFNGKSSSKQDGKEISKGEFVLKFEGSNINLNGTIEDLVGGAKSKFDITLNSDKNAKVDISEPTGAEDLQKFVMSMLGGGAQNNPGNDGLVEGSDALPPNLAPGAPTQPNNLPPAPTNTIPAPKTK